MLAPQVDGLHLVKKRSNNLQNKPSGSSDVDLQASNKNSVSDKVCLLKYSLELVISEL